MVQIESAIPAAIAGDTRSDGCTFRCVVTLLSYKHGSNHHQPQTRNPCPYRKPRFVCMSDRNESGILATGRKTNRTSLAVAQPPTRHLKQLRRPVEQC